jgi:hypothetical protein
MWSPRGDSSIRTPTSPTGTCFVQPWPAAPSDKRRDHTFFYQYRTDRARRTLRGIDQQIAKAENALAGKTAVKRNRYVRLTGATKSVNRTLEAKNRALAGIKGYVTNLPNPDPDQVITAYGRLLNIDGAVDRQDAVREVERSTAVVGVAVSGV